jgi:4-hydroxy-2-oxoheptanedioate aldolase
VPVIVRPPEISREWISRLLDIGADGIFAPRVHTAEDARAAVRYAKYPPIGDRGDDGRIHGAFPRSEAEQKYANENTVVVVIVESKGGADHIDEICETPGVDAVSIGPSDLTMSLGIPGERESETYSAIESQIIDSCHKHGMPITIGTAPSVADAIAQRDVGCSSVFMDDEIGVISQAVAKYTAEVKALIPRTLGKDVPRAEDGQSIGTVRKS